MAGIPAGAADAAKRRYVLGAGRVYFAPLDSAGAARAERYLGSSPGFTLNVTAEETEVFDDDGPIAEKVVQVTRQVAHAFNVTCKNITAENMALFVGGEVVSQADTAVAMDGNTQAVADARDAIVVRELDRFYKLGIYPVATSTPARPAKPAGVRAISATPGDTIVSSSADGTGVIAASADNYVVDAAHGRLYIPTGGAISDGDTIYVEYTPVAATIPRVDFSDPKQVRGALRYIEDSANKNVPAGNFGYEFYAPLVTVTPGGEMAVKSRENPQTISLSVAVQEPSAGPSFSVLQQAA